MKQRWRFSIIALALLSLEGWGGAASAIDAGAECWADGRCQLYGCDPWDTDCGPIPNTVVDMAVKRYTSATLSNADADAILDEANDILQTDDGSNDVACTVAFLRKGNVTSFSTGDGSIDSQAEFNAVIALSGQVKVVNTINWCGALIPNVVGCAPQPGSSEVVVRFGTTHTEAICWAHEYGHTRGLPHRSGDVIMNGTNASRNTQVNSTECTAFKS